MFKKLVSLFLLKPSAWYKEVETSWGTRREVVPENVVFDAIRVLVYLYLLLTLWPFWIVPNGSEGVITEFGKITRIEPEGLHFVSPTETLKIFNMRVKEVAIEDAEGGTSDQQPVFTSLTARYRIHRNQIAMVYRDLSHDGDLSGPVNTATKEVFKAVTSQYTAPELLTKRQEVSQKIKALLNEKVSIYGAEVVNIDMTTFRYGPDYMAAINMKVTEEQKKLAAENAALTAKAKAQEKVYQAEAERDAAKAKADGDAYQKLEVAKAEASALREVNKAIQESKDLLEYERIKVAGVWAGRWDGSVPTTVMGNGGVTPTVPYMQVPFLNK